MARVSKKQETNVRNRTGGTLTIKLRGELADRVEHVAGIEDIDATAVVRVILNEHLPLWEKRLKERIS